MEYVQQYLNPSVLLSITIVIFTLPFLYHHLLCKHIKDHPSNKTQQPPPPPEAGGSWPIIGHIHLLGGCQPIYEVLGRMADKHGPIFTVRTGVHRDLVVSDYKIAKECLTTNDKAFANRPKTLASKVFSFDYAMFAFSPYGPFWRQTRKMVTTELLANHRVEALGHVREAEVKTAIRELYKDRDKVIDMSKWFSDVTLNLLFRVVAGKRYLEVTGSERCRKALRDSFELIGCFYVSDAIPWLKWLDLGREKAMKETRRELDSLAQRCIDDKMRKRVSSNNDHDLMDSMLSILHDDEEKFGNTYDPNTIIRAISMGIIVAGSDTTKITMIWTLALLLNNRDALTKAQQELDQHVGKERLVNESDIKNLVYLKAIVKETLRLYPATPLSIPRESSEDCTIAGHHIPAHTRLIVNIRKLQRDPKVWASPDHFRPERFLDENGKNMDIRGQSFELMPFGGGRRICPGVSFAT